MKPLDRIELKDTTAYFLGGKEVTEAEYRAVYPLPEPGAVVASDRRKGCDAWREFEMKSLAVHPKQVEQARARAKRHGVQVQYKDDGTVVASGPAARKELMKMEGYHDESGFGGVYG